MLTVRHLSKRYGAISVLRGVDFALEPRSFIEGITVLCNLHQVELAQEFSDRILGMCSGAICFDRPSHAVQDADLTELYHRLPTP